MARKLSKGRSERKRSRNDGFYGTFLAAESLAEASSIGSGDEAAGDGGEIAELRRRLAKALNRRPDDLRLLAQGANLLVRAAAAEHSLSPGAKGQLADSVISVLKDLGEQLIPPGS
jgi:hypothetical protein